MLEVSVAVVFIAVFTTVCMVFSERSSVVLVIGMLAANLLCLVITGGDFSGVQEDLAWNYDYREWWRLLICIWVPGDYPLFIDSLLFILIMGSFLERRISSVTYFAILYGGMLVGEVQWSAFCSHQFMVFGPTVAAVSVVCTTAAMFGKMDIVLPKPIGNTGFNVVMVFGVWAAVTALIMVVENSDYVFSAAILFSLVAIFSGVIGLALDSKQVREKLGSILLRERHVDVGPMEKLCCTDDQREFYKSMVSVSDPCLRDIWAEMLAPKLKCPECGKRLEVVNRRIVCRRGHFLHRSLLRLQCDTGLSLIMAAALGIIAIAG